MASHIRSRIQYLILTYNTYMRRNNYEQGRRSRQDIYLTSSVSSTRSSLYSRQAGVSGFWCHRLERPASPRRICAVTRRFQRTTTQVLSVFPFLPRRYHITRVLLSPFITTVWTPVVFAIINIIYTMLKCL